MGFHPAAIYAVLDRLAAPLHPWQRFELPGLGGRRRRARRAARRELADTQRLVEGSAR